MDFATPRLRERAANAFSALRYPNYRLWFTGQLVSLLGSWMQGTAQGYLVYELTHSPAYLGLVAFASGIAPWLFMLYAGAVADRLSRRRVLIATQLLMMVLASIQAALTFAGLIEPWHIVALSFGFGIANTFDAPARHSFVMELVKPEDLTNAIALNSSMFNLAVAVGPAIAGVTYALFGPAWCFLINAVSYFSVIAALNFMHLQPTVTKHTASIRTELVEGLRFAWGDRNVRLLLGIVLANALFGMSFVTLIPAWAVNVLGGDATTNGYLQSARGVGALLGALSIASLGHFNFRGRMLSRASLFFPVVLVLFAFARAWWLSFALLVGVGASMMITQNLCNSLIQTGTPERMRGRIMGFYSLSFFGFAPLGGLGIGVLASGVGEPASIMTGAILFFLVAAFIRVKWPDVSRME